MSTYSTNILGTPGLLNYWQLDETSGTSAADSNGSNTGTYHSCTLNQTTSPNMGSSVQFNGSSSYVSTTNTVSGLSTLSMEAWVYPTSAPGTTGYIAGLWQSSFWSFVLYIDSNLRPNLYCYDSAVKLITSPIPLVLNKWCHISGSCQSNGVSKLYVDGLVVGTNGIANLRTNYTSPNVYIGGGTSSFGYFTGKIDEVTLYNNVLSPSDIASHIQASGYTTTARTSQVLVQALYSTAPIVRVTQVPVEVAYSTLQQVNTSQVVVEVLRSVSSLVNGSANLYSNPSLRGTSKGILSAVAKLPIASSFFVDVFKFTSASATIVSNTNLTSTAGRTTNGQVCLTIASTIVSKAIIGVSTKLFCQSRVVAKSGIIHSTAQGILNINSVLIGLPKTYAEKIQHKFQLGEIVFIHSTGEMYRIISIDRNQYLLDNGRVYDESQLFRTYQQAISHQQDPFVIREISIDNIERLKQIVPISTTSSKVDVSIPIRTGCDPLAAKEKAKSNIDALRRKKPPGGMAFPPICKPD